MSEKLGWEQGKQKVHVAALFLSFWHRPLGQNLVWALLNYSWKKASILQGTAAVRGATCRVMSEKSGIQRAGPVHGAGGTVTLGIQAEVWRNVSWGWGKGYKARWARCWILLGSKRWWCGWRGPGWDGRVQWLLDQEEEPGQTLLFRRQLRNCIRGPGSLVSCFSLAFI